MRGAGNFKNGIHMWVLSTKKNVVFLWVNQFIIIMLIWLHSVFQEGNPFSQYYRNWRSFPVIVIVKPACWKIRFPYLLHAAPVLLTTSIVQSLHCSHPVVHGHWLASAMTCCLRPDHPWIQWVTGAGLVAMTMHHRKKTVREQMMEPAGTCLKIIITRKL